MTDVTDTALSAWISQNILLFFLAYARIGTALLVMPGFGDSRVPQRAKIAISATLTFAMLGALPLPAVPDQPAQLVVLLAFEVLIGVFLGMGVRLFFLALQVLGGIIGYSSSLSNALAPPDANFEGASTVAALLQMSLIAIFFLTDIHHVLIGGFLRSYEAMPAGAPMLGDMVEQMARLGSQAFHIAVMVGAPFLVFTILLNLSLGLANKVMPSMQVFFVAGPGLILIGLAILAIMAPSIMDTVSGAMSDWLIELVA